MILLDTNICIPIINPNPPDTDTPMPIDISKEARTLAIASIERYFKENMDEPIGNIAAGALLGFFLSEVGPTIYNQGVADAQERLQARVMELDLEVHEDEFTYWQQQGRGGQRGRR